MNQNNEQMTLPSGATISRADIEALAVMLGVDEAVQDVVSDRLAEDDAGTAPWSMPALLLDYELKLHESDQVALRVSHGLRRAGYSFGQGKNQIQAVRRMMTLAEDHAAIELAAIILTAEALADGAKITSPLLTKAAKRYNAGRRATQ